MKKIILALSFVFLFISMFFLRHYLSIFFFQNDRYKTAVNIEVTEKLKDSVFVCFNKNCDTLSYKNNVYSYKLNQENSIFYLDNKGEIEVISYDKDFINKIKNVSIFSKGFEYKNSFKQNKISFQDKEAYSVNISYLNPEKNLFKKLAVYFESIFYNWYFYIISYILICLYFLKYRPDFKLKSELAMALILFLGLFLRLSHIDFIPLWNDELYSVYYMSDGRFNFLKTFTDAGNPPLFFIVSNIWLLFFNKTIFTIRLLPCIVGVFNIFSIYFVANRILNKKIALTASFLAAINIFIVLESTEIRSYILSMTLVIWSGYAFYGLYKNFSNKNLFFYFIIQVLLVNIHYYTALFAVFNLILGVFIFKKNRNFIILNIISFLTLLPYLVNVFKISLSEAFNTWLEKPTLDVLNNHIIFYFGNILFFILVILFSVFVIKKYLQINERSVVLYNISAIAFVFISAYLFSIFIKPVLFERYFCIFLPFLIINTAIFLNTDYKTKYNPLITLIIFIISINIPKYENFNLFSNINQMIEYSLSDSQNIKNYYFIVPDRIDYIKHFKNIEENRIIVSNDGIREDKDLMKIYKSKAKEQNAVFYMPEICINSKIKFSKTLNVKAIQTTMVPVYKVLPD